MQQKIKTLLVFLVCMADAVLLFSQETDRFFSKYKFNYLTDKTGLPHSFVDDLIRDSDGYIWMATHQGIARYDGYQYLTYDTQTDVRLKNNFVHKLCEDNFHRLWIASEGGIDILDLKTYSLTMLRLPADSPLLQVMNSYVNTLYKDGKGNLWISGNDALWCVELDEEGDVRTYYSLKADALSPVQALVDVDGTVCAGINNEVCSLQRQAGHLLKATPLSATLQPYSEDWRIQCMQKDGDLLWIGTNRGLFSYNLPSGALKRYRYSTHRPGMLSQAYITDITLTAAGHLIVSTLNGLNVYHRSSDTFSFIRQGGEQDVSALNSNAINCLLTEGETIWVGTETGGVNLLALKRLQTEVWACPIQTSIKAGNPVNTIAEDREGNLWIGLLEKGLMKWNVENGTCSRYLFSPNDITSLSNNTLTGLLVDASNHLWGYTWGVGINGLDLNSPGNIRFRRYTREEIPSLEGDFISSACDDAVNKGCWFGSTRGAHFYDKQRGVFVRLLFAESDNEFEAVSALLADSKNRLWIGTTEGVFVVDLLSFARSHRNFDYTYLKYKLDEPSSTQLEKINCIFQDCDGTVWLGGSGSGLYQLVSDDNNRFVFRNYTVHDGLPDNTVNGITQDGKGNLWLTTIDGLSRLHIESMTFSNFMQADGLPSTRFYGNGIHYSARYDRIYLATADGLVMVHLGKEQTTYTHPQVKLASLTVGSDRVYPHVCSISLHERESRFSASFTTQNYGNSSRVRFAYRLKGYEKEWNETQPGDCVARYNFVPSGRYVLQVRATDEWGHWSDRTTEVVVAVTPYFYKSLWFYLLVAVLTVLLMLLLYRRKTRSYRRQKELLEKEVEQRTRELAERNEQLERMARHVEEVTEEKIAFFTNITHEFRTPVTLIHGPIEHALKEVKEEGVKKQLMMAERNSRYLLSLVNELMDFRKLDTDKVTLDVQPCRFTALLSDLLLPFTVFARERNIEIRTFYRLPHPCLKMDAAYMRKAIINLVSNAVKFMPDGGRIDLYVASVRGDDGRELLYINVSDTGHGIVEEEADRLFERFYQSKQRVTYPVYGQSGTGIGLFLCKKIVELHEGRIYARNNHRRGASFRMLLPLLRADEAEVAGGTPREEREPQATELVPEVGTRKETILVVEDNHDMRSYICTMLRGEYRLLEAENGEEALELIQRQAVDLVVSDLMMPVMDGMELSRRIKENIATSHIPFLMLTAIRSEVQEKKSFEIGVDEYLCKPFDEEVLRLRIRNILNLRNRYKKMFSTNSKVEELHIKEESRDKTFIANAIGLMEKHYPEAEYNLECFVRDMGYSKTLVNRKMQDLTGQTIGQFMKGFRLNVAQRIIRENGEDVNVSEVAYAVGFNDPKYFTKCFKEQFGYLPSSKIKK